MKGEGGTVIRCQGCQDFTQISKIYMGHPCPKLWFYLTRSPAFCLHHLMLRVAWILILLGSFFTASELKSATLDGTLADSQDSLSNLVLSVQAVKDNPSLGPSLKKKVLEQYNLVRQELTWISERETRLDVLDQVLQRGKVPQDLGVTESHPRFSLPSPEVLGSWSVVRLEQELVMIQNELLNFRKDLRALETRRRRHANRRLRLPRLQAETRQIISSIEGEQPLAMLEPESLRLASLALRNAKLRRLRLELVLYEKEILGFDFQTLIIDSSLDNARGQLGLGEKSLETLRNVLRRRREHEAEQAKLRALEMQVDISKSHPVIQSISHENANFTAELAESQGPWLDGIIEEKEKYRSMLAKVREEHRALRKRASSHAIDEVLAFLFRKYQAELPAIESFQRRRAQIQSSLSRSQLAILGYQEVRSRQARKPSFYLSHGLKIGKRLTLKSLIGSASDEAERLRLAQDGLLEQLILGRNTLIYRLVDIDTVLDELITEVEAFRSYIYESIFWIRSHRLWQPSYLLNFDSLRAWFLSPENWGASLQIGVRKIRLSWLSFGFLVLALVLQLVFRRYGLRFMDQAGQRWEKDGISALYPIFQAFGWALFLSLLWPTVFFMGFWSIDDPSHSTDFSTGLSRGLSWLSAFSFVFSFILLVLRRPALGEHLLLWKGEGSKPLRRNLRVFLTFAYPCILLYSMLVFAPSEEIRDLQRLFFCFPLVLLCIFLPRSVHPEGSFLGPILIRKPSSLLFRYRWIWYSIAIILPGALSAISIAGYHYAAFQVLVRTLQSLGCFFVILILRKLFMRFVFLLRKTLLREKLREEAEPHEETPASPTLDSEQIQVQVQRFLQGTATVLLLIGFWVIWSDLLPALQILDRVELWSVAQQVSHTVVDATGISSLEIMDKPMAITLGHLIISMLIILFTFLASRNIPGMLEVFLLRRLNFARGHSYATVTVLQYIVVIMGITIACSFVGITWDRVQWLAAALTVGLGFGLQEIFANFVAGIIILFEQPMRINDLVTVGETTGKVTEIKIRATTITDLNNRELIVPNKDFITGSLVNWSLSNPILRLDIPVGVAYKEDARRVQDILLDVADKHRDVLEDPKPVVIFNELGDSSLNFELRVHIKDLDNFPIVHSSVLTDVFERLRLEEIEIPFPQRDVHIRELPDTLAAFGSRISKSTKKCPETLR
jgi:potassium-dependent mechanosensitive channel